MTSRATRTIGAKTPFSYAFPHRGETTERRLDEDVRGAADRAEVVATSGTLEARAREESAAEGSAWASMKAGDHALGTTACAGRRRAREGRTMTLARPVG
jgi:hypothetical protein